MGLPSIIEQIHANKNIGDHRFFVFNDCRLWATSR